MRSTLLYVFIILLCSKTVLANIAAIDTPAFKIAAVLQSDMVIQQGKNLKLWGTASVGQTVNIGVDWLGKTTNTTTGADGKWIAQVAVPKAKPGDFTPHTITLSSGNTTVKLTNILIGEVWLCIGQSNMDMPVTQVKLMTYPGVLNYQQEIAAANFPAIRVFRDDAQFRIAPSAEIKGSWKICSPATAGNFSGTAYFFGRELFLKLNLPIGLVVAAAPGASTQAFTKREVLENDSVLKRVYLAPREKQLSSQKVVDTTGFFTKVTWPTLLYNGAVYPFLNLFVKGIAYYQGESNARSDKRADYIRLFSAMLADWRKDFKQGDLPFYYTQIAPNLEGNEDTLTYNAAIFRETQQQLLKLKNTGMAVTLDAGEKHNVHPPDKRSVGERLAKNALNKTYGLKELAYEGPRFSKFVIEGNTIKIIYDAKSTGTGLTTKDGKAPRCFFVAGDDKIFHPAQANIIGNTLILSNFGTDKPVAIRYAFTNWADANLQNKEGLPAMQFRTDTWD